MDKNNYKRRIKTEANAHITLGMLLRKRRSIENRKIIEKILRSRLSINDKINEIRKADDLYEKASLKQEKKTVEIDVGNGKAPANQQDLIPEHEGPDSKRPPAKQVAFPKPKGF